LLVSDEEKRGEQVVEAVLLDLYSLKISLETKLRGVKKLNYVHFMDRTNENIIEYSHVVICSRSLVFSKIKEVELFRF